MKVKARAAIYTRLSKEDFDKGENVSESIRNQESMLTSYAAERGWEIYDIYCDDSYSGAYAGDDNTRPEFNRMIEDASIHRFDIVLCKSQSRFSRNMEVVEQYINGKFTEWGIRFIGVVDYVDTDVKGNKKSRQINSLVNEWYLEDLSENIRAVYRHKMRQGEYMGAFAPYGYSRDKEQKNHLIINPVTAPVVRQIFEWYADGIGTAKISRMLNEKKIPSPRKQQEIEGLRKTLMYARYDMGSWSAGTVGDILHNRAYCGDVVQHTVEKVSYKSRKRRRLSSVNWIVAENMHEPLVSREMFDEVQERFNKRRRPSIKRERVEAIWNLG
ncbi:MAG: recombinase family protein [Clostridia bacterium]|nr:recombinase family protein [Clostridia bacterium]